MTIVLAEIHNNLVEKNSQKIGLIGDLDGNFEYLIRHLHALGVISKKGEWIGGNAHLIFSGDILADRFNTGFDILLKIHELRIAAGNSGGSIDVLAGNHESFMFLYFRSKNIKTFSSENLSKIKFGSEYYGMTELMPYGKERDEIIINMRTNLQGRIILEEICKMKLITYTEDNLHFHTPPSANILDIMEGFCKYNEHDLRKSINHINILWEASLRSILLGEKFPHTIGGKTAEDVYDMFHNSFLHTYNGSIGMIKKRVKEGFDTKKHRGNIVPEEHPMYKIIYVSGFKVIYYGHDSKDLEISGIATESVNRIAKWIKKEGVATDLIREGILKSFIDIELPLTR